ncbi:MAG: PorV/PorQ family protein [Candidatus Neomarinimicrobiota bacterium]
MKFSAIIHRRFGLPGITALLLWSSLTNLQASGGQAGSYLRLGTSARAIGMGNGFTAVRDNAFSAYYNPGSLGFRSVRSLSVTNQFLSLDRRHSAISFAANLPPAAGIGIVWIHAGVVDIDGRTASGAHTETYSSSEDAIFFSFARQFKNRISIGITLKILQNQLPTGDKKLQGSGIGYDAGILYKVNNKLSAGLILQNINSAYQWSSDAFTDRKRVYEDQFPLDTKFGLSYTTNSFFAAADLGVEIVESEILSASFQGGVEYYYSESTAFRFGLQNNTFTFGAGITHSLLDRFDSRIDYAVRIESVTQPTHIVSYAFTF